MSQPYKHNFRLKSFLTAFGRVKIAEVAMSDLDTVIRIQTDGVLFNKNLKLDFPALIREDKSTGVIKWRHVNKYEKI